MNHLPRIDISVVPHRKQRYDTAGDYFKKGGELHIRVSKMNAEHEFYVALHELIEWYGIEQAGVSIDSIDQFDIEFEKKRKAGDLSEPGDDLNAPYYKEHQFATLIERMVVEHFGGDWKKYSEHVNKL